MLNLKGFFKQYLPLIGIFFIVAALFVANFTSGTVLSGWDNLHPEFDLFHNYFDKALFGVWHESYGLGAQLGNSVSTEVIRVPFLILVRILVGISHARYTWHFLMVFVGATGLFYLLKNRLLPQNHIEITTAAAFLGAVFYILNIGTVQNFYVPLEAFSHFYAFLPWLFFVLLNFLTTPTKRNLILFFLVNILATPAFYIPTLFIVYILFLVVVLLFSLIFRQVNLKLICMVLLAILTANLYWLLPFGYFVASCC
jgi:hypothetical protein